MGEVLPSSRTNSPPLNNPKPSHFSLDVKCDRSSSHAFKMATQWRTAHPDAAPEENSRRDRVASMAASPRIFLSPPPAVFIHPDMPLQRFKRVQRASCRTDRKGCVKHYVAVAYPRETELSALRAKSSSAVCSARDFPLVTRLFLREKFAG